LLAGLVIVRVSVVVPPMGVEAGAKALAMAGGATTLCDSLSELPLKLVSPAYVAVSVRAPGVVRVMTQEPAAQNRDQAQAWLRLKGYTPTTLHLSAFKRLGARMTAANVAFDDHPNEKRFADRIETVTVDSVFAWLNRSGLGGTVQVIR
jgi:hypothetical protein